MFGLQPPRHTPTLPFCGHSLRSAATAYDAPLRHSFDAYFGRIIGSHALSFARTMRRRRVPERHDGHWGLGGRSASKEIMTTENPISYRQASSAGWPHLADRSASPGGGPVWVNCRDPAVIREGQLHPSKPTNPPARSIVSSVPIADIPRTPSLGDGSRPFPDIRSGAMKSRFPATSGFVRMDLTRYRHP
jgi:hypothetical protein